MAAIIAPFLFQNVSGVQNIKPGPMQFNDSITRNAGNKSAGAFFYMGRGGRPCNRRKTKKRLRYGGTKAPSARRYNYRVRPY